MNLLDRIASLGTSSAAQKSNEPSQSLSFLPWVVQFAAEAADTAVLDDAVYDSMGSVPNVDPLGHVLWQFCRREQQRIGISLKPESQVRFFSNLAATSDEWFPVDQVNSVHELLAGEPSYQGETTHIEFLRKHGFLRVIGKETPNNCRFEYPEVQDYLRARVAVDSICGGPSVLGEDDVFRRCAIEQARLVDFISLLLRWRLPQQAIIDALALQRNRLIRLGNSNSTLARAGLLQILLRTLRDNEALTGTEVTQNLCRYFGDKTGRVIENGYLYGLFSRLDLRGVCITNTTFHNAYLEHCRFNSETVFDNCTFQGDFVAALNCRGLGDAIVRECKLSDSAAATFRHHKNKVGRAPVDRPHIDDACHEILKQFLIGQMGLRSKAFDNVASEAAKASPIGEDVLAELIRCRVLIETKAGTRHSLEVADKSAVSSFLQQSIVRGTVAEAIKRLVKRHIKRLA